MFMGGVIRNVSVGLVPQAPWKLSLTYYGENSEGVPYSLTFDMDMFQAIAVTGDLARTLDAAARIPEVAQWMYQNKEPWGGTDEDVADMIRKLTA